MIADKSLAKDEVRSTQKTLNCFICGNEYAMRRIENHIFICEQKWESDQLKLQESERKQCPKAPPGFFNIIKKRSNNIQVYQPNEEPPTNQFEETPIHVIHGPDAFKVPEVVDEPTTLESCPHCSRTFLPERLKIHLKSCKADKPLKMRT